MPTLKRPQRKQRNRRALQKDQPPRTLALVPTSIDFTTPNITLVFPVPVVLRGIPQYLTNTAQLPDTATRGAPNVVVLHYAAPGAVTTITVPDQDTAIRSSTGGYVTPGTFPAA